MLRQLRVRHGVAQTPVARYENRKTGRTVTLIGTMHIGTSSYFSKLNDIIAELEASGAVVYYEGIYAATEAEWAAAADTERAQRGFPRTIRNQGILAVCGYLGWVEQGAGLKVSPSWRNVDLTDLELVRRAGPHNISAVSAGLSSVSAGIAPERLGVVLASGEALLARLLALDRFRLVPRLITRAAGHAHVNLGQVMVDDRNSGALARLPPDADAVLLWGTDHLTGLAAGLKRAGFRHRSTTWVSVGKLPAFWPSLRTFWASLRTPDDDSSRT